MSLENREQILVRCESIAHEIQRRAVQAKGGSLMWRVEARDGDRPVILGPYLYGGTSGIVLYLAALYHVTRGESYREVAKRALAPLRARMAELAANPEGSARLRLGLGGLTGLGSLLYSFLRIGEWLEEPALVALAFQLTSLFTAERIAADEVLDFTHGSAGAILALLALHHSEHGTRCDSPLDVAIECANHLLAQRVSHEERPRAWPPLPGRPPLTGFSHGAAGICYALAKLYAATGREEIRNAVLEGLAYERSLFVPEEANWRDMRSPSHASQTSWCHGAPGIALGRIALLDLLDDCWLREEISVGLGTLDRLPLCEIDHLCCGNMGRAEIWLTAAGRIADPTYLDRAREITSQVCCRADQSGHGFALEPGGPRFGPTLFRGTAGIGYALLRLARPAALPSILLLE